MKIPESRHEIVDSPFNLPLLLLKSFVDRLPYGALHQVDVAHDLVRESIPEVLVELSVLEIVYKHDQYE